MQPTEWRFAPSASIVMLHVASDAGSSEYGNMTLAASDPCLAHGLTSCLFARLFDCAHSCMRIRVSVAEPYETVVASSAAGSE